MSAYIVDRMGGGESQDDEPTLQRMEYQLDSLREDDPEHATVRLVHRESRWGIEVYRGGLIILQNTAIAGSQKHMRCVGREQVLELWQALAKGDLVRVMCEPWVDGYGV